MNDNNLTNENLLLQAQQEEEQGNINEAITSWSTLFNRKPDPVFLWHIGRLTLLKGELEEAEKIFLSITTLEPRLYLTYEWLGMLYEDLNELEKACEYYKKCLTLKQSAHTWSLLGIAQSKLGIFSEAIISFTNALKIDPNYEDVHYNLAIIFKNEQPNEAVSMLKKAIELNPQYANAHRELGGLLLTQEDKDTEAEYHIKKAIELNSNDGWAYIYLGNFMWGKKEYNKAEEAYKKAIDLWPNESSTYWCLAQFYENQNRIEEAYKLYEQALNIDPDDIDSNLQLATFLKNRGEYQKAKAYLEHALDIDPNDEDVKEALNDLFEFQKQ